MTNICTPLFIVKNHSIRLWTLKIQGSISPQLRQLTGLSAFIRIQKKTSTRRKILIRQWWSGQNWSVCLMVPKLCLYSEREFSINKSKFSCNGRPLLQSWDVSFNNQNRDYPPIYAIIHWKCMRDLHREHRERFQKTEKSSEERSGDFFDVITRLAVISNKVLA